MNRSRSDMGFRRWATLLFEQQMWCFGRDILRTKGNALLDLGMCQYRAPSPDRGFTLYTAAVAPGESVFLWGFGVMLAKQGVGSILIPRNDFAPRLTTMTTGLGIHKLVDFGRLANPISSRERSTVRTVLSRLISWFATYEHWISETYGSEYRKRVVDERGKAPVVPSREMAVAWERAAKQCRHTDCELTARGPWGQVMAQLRPFSSHRVMNRAPTQLSARGYSK